MRVFWVVAPCSLGEVYRRFRGACCLHHQGDEASVNLHQTTWRNNPEDSHLHTRHRQNLKSHLGRSYVKFSGIGCIPAFKWLVVILLTDNSVDFYFRSWLLLQKIIYGEIHTVGKEEFVAWFWVLSGLLLAEPRTTKTVGTDSKVVEIRTECLPNITQRRYRWSNLLGLLQLLCLLNKN
jgi:hypothetical protein